jgi:hypothetical protein
MGSTPSSREVVGIDVAKDSLEVALGRDGARAFRNDSAGHDGLLEHLRGKAMT